MSTKCENKIFDKTFWFVIAMGIGFVIGHFGTIVALSIPLGQ